MGEWNTYDKCDNRTNTVREVSLGCYRGRQEEHLTQNGGKKEKFREKLQEKRMQELSLELALNSNFVPFQIF